MSHFKSFVNFCWNCFQVGSLSLLSSAAASDDQSDLNDSETGEATPPLFLQVSVI